MEGTYQTVETLKDKVKTLNEKNDSLALESKENRSLYEEENKKAITFKNEADMWKVATYVMTAIAIVEVVAAII